jgi:hypothetical protein
MAIPDFFDLIATRLQIALGEIAGIKRVFKLAPTSPLLIGDLPSFFLLSAPMVNTAGANVRIIRDFTYRLCVAPFQAPSLESGTDGFYVLNRVWTFIPLVQEYIFSHPRLSTTTLQNIGYLDQDVLIRDTGAIMVNAPNGVFGGCDFTFTVSTRYQSGGYPLS